MRRVFHSRGVSSWTRFGRVLTGGLQDVRQVVARVDLAQPEGDDQAVHDPDVADSQPGPAEQPVLSLNLAVWREPLGFRGVTSITSFGTRFSTKNETPSLPASAFFAAAKRVWAATRLCAAVGAGVLCATLSAAPRLICTDESSAIRHSPLWTRDGA